MSAAARQGDVGAAGGRKHETAVPDGPVDTCGARGMDGQRFPFEKVRERDVRSAGGRDVRKHRTRTTVGSCRPLMEVLFR